VDTRTEAARKRRDFRFTWGSYLQLVRLARAAGLATSDALETAAWTGGGWAFARIQDALESAQSAHEPLWRGLADLGQQIGVSEVTELAETIRGAGSEGTKIAETLAAAGESQRRRLTTDIRAKANGRTTTMIVPLALLTLGFLLLLAFPAFAALLGTP
jgi:Flp pilus assembly protein TadB